jgi:hypothetical protein
MAILCRKIKPIRQKEPLETSTPLNKYPLNNKTKTTQTKHNRLVETRSQMSEWDSQDSVPREQWLQLGWSEASLQFRMWQGNEMRVRRLVLHSWKPDLLPEDVWLWRLGEQPASVLPSVHEGGSGRYAARIYWYMLSPFCSLARNFQQIYLYKKNICLCVSICVICLCVCMCVFSLDLNNGLCY